MAERKEAGMGERGAVIWKYPLALTDEQELDMPEGASPLTVQFQNGCLAMWASADVEIAFASARREVRSVYIVGTGHPFKFPLRTRYVGTAQEPGQPLVWHVYISETETSDA